MSKSPTRISLVVVAVLLPLLMLVRQAVREPAWLRLMHEEVEAKKDPKALALMRAITSLDRECRSLAEQGRQIDGTSMSLALRMQYDERVREQQRLLQQHARLTQRIAVSHISAAGLREIAASDSVDAPRARAELERRQVGGQAPLTGAEVVAEVPAPRRLSGR